MDPVAAAALAQAASTALVTAAVTDSWEGLRHRIVRLFGRGSTDEQTARRLTATHQQLNAVSPGELAQAQATEAAAWRIRFADLLADHPEAADELDAIVKEIRASGGSVAVGRDMTLSAERGGIAAGVVHGNVTGQVVLPARAEPGRMPVSLPPRPLALAGREQLLDEVHQMLTQDAEPGVVVLTGLGGAGKTSVAVEYAHRHLAEVAVAWLVHAGEPSVLVAELAELAAQLGGRDLADPRGPVASVHAVLAARPTEWLLIFDNVRDESSIRPYLPPAGHGRVLITSQSQHWADARVADVPALDEVIAARFLMSRTGDPDEAAAHDLAREVGGLPLALEQAAAYVKATAGTLAGYSRAFRARRDDLLVRGEASGHPETVAATLALALSRLEPEDQTATALLQLLACLAPEPIPLGLLLEAGQRSLPMEAETPDALSQLIHDSIAASDGIAALRRYSLVSPGTGGLVQVHRLVQAVTRSQTPRLRIAQCRSVAAVLVEAAIPAEVDHPRAWPACSALLPHALTALSWASQGMGRIAEYIGQSGDRAGALEFWQRVLQARLSVDGPEPAHVLQARAAVAYWTGMAGSAAEARDLYSAVLPLSEDVLGPEHPETLTVRAHLARWTGMAGDPAAARDQFAALLPITEQVCGTEHHATLAARGNIARWTGLAGDYRSARDQLASLLPVRRRISGPDHPTVLTTRHSLAFNTGLAGDAAAARDQFRELLADSVAILGETHPDTLSTRQELAHWTGEAGDAASARDQLAVLVPIRERVSGVDYYQSVAARAGLKHWSAEAERQAQMSGHPVGADPDAP